MRQELEALIAGIVTELFEQEVQAVVTRTAKEHGDFACNIAMQLAGRLGKNPREIAESIASKLQSTDWVAGATVAGPGFINISLTDHVVYRGALRADEVNRVLEGKLLVTEYSDPNPFKVLHAGHLYTTLMGDAISNILETAGAEVKRTNFGGDVGLHVARAMWGILKALGGENPDGLASIDPGKRAEWISERYVEGNTAYENDETAKQEITELNKRVYQIHENNDHESQFAQIYWTCRQWSYDGFAKLYDELEVQPFDKYYPESETSDKGVELVEKALDAGVLVESDGAVVFKGEEHGLHTRVFINSAGLPTYEAKDLGLNYHKVEDYPFDGSVIITGNDIIEYMKVVLRVMAHFYPDIEAKTKHLTHGIVKLPGGKKMSSRAGSVVLAEDILKAAYEASEKQDRQIVLGAVRYSFLKTRLGGDIVYDPSESVSMEGNSGPYLQYALVRARSILRKIGDFEVVEAVEDLDGYERDIAVKLSEYQEVFDAALREYSPHFICNYLYELAQVFNRFYENCRVIDDPRFERRASLTRAYEAVLAHGLTVLGMPKPEKM